MLRYRNPDDLGAQTSAFTICSFWWAEVLALVGRLDDAVRVFERLLTHANPLWLETTRQFLGHFDSSLASILELFRKTDALHADPDPRKKEPYGRAEVFTETLGLSPKDVGILTPIRLRWQIGGYFMARKIQRPRSSI